MDFNTIRELTEDAKNKYSTFYDWFLEQMKSGLSYNAIVEKVTVELIEEHKVLSKKAAENANWGRVSGTVIEKEPSIGDSIEDELLKEIKEPAKPKAPKFSMPKSK